MPEFIVVVVVVAVAVASFGRTMPFFFMLKEIVFFQLELFFWMFC